VQYTTSRRYGLRALEISKEMSIGWEEFTSVGEPGDGGHWPPSAVICEDVSGPGDHKGAMVVRINGRRARKVPRVLSRGRQYSFRLTESQVLAI
jgi:hypothetical protein